MGIHEKNRGWPAWGILIAMAMIFYLVSVSAPVFSEDYFIEYFISGQSCKIVSAVTPFDSNEKTRNVFLKWFKKGVETVLSEGQPLDIEWRQSPEGQAGLKGYETGLQEGEACLKEIKKSGQPIHKTRKTPLEFLNTSEYVFKTRSRSLCVLNSGMPPGEEAGALRYSVDRYR